MIRNPKGEVALPSDNGLFGETLFHHSCAPLALFFGKQCENTSSSINVTVTSQKPVGGSFGRVTETEMAGTEAPLAVVGTVVCLYEL